MILRDLKQLGCFVAVAVPSIEGQHRARRYGADEVVSDLADLSDQLDGYVVAVPTAGHLASVQKLLRHDKPIFVEKPLTDKLQGARKLLPKMKVQVFVLHKWRYHRAIEEMC